MRRNNTFRIIAGLLLLFIISCSKKEYSEKPFTSDWLVPLIKTEITPLILTTLQNKEASFVVRGEDLGLPQGQSVSSLADIDAGGIPPFIIFTNELISGIQLDRGNIRLSIFNGFPVPVEAGSEMSVRSSTVLDAGKVAVVSIPQRINPGEVFEIPFDLENAVFGDALYIHIDHLKINAFQDQVFNEGILLDFLFEEVVLKEIIINTRGEYEIADTIDFDGSVLDFDDDETGISGSEVSATLKLKAKNELPADMYFQMYFTDENLHALDSLFVTLPEIKAAAYSNNQFEKSTVTEAEVVLTKDRIAKIKNATKVIYNGVFHTRNYPGTEITVERDRSVSLKVIGDLHLAIDPFKL